MRNRIFALFFTLIGFTSSIFFPVWAVSTQVIILRANCGESVLDKLGVTLSGAVAIACIVVLVAWKYFSALFRDKFRSHRTPLAFFSIGYLVVFVINYLADSLELIFLFGTIGAAIAAICYYVSDMLKGRR